jgi:tRNA pseudouridine32 synthase / 23S rRNA pseudouridine746 synthase
LILYRDAMMLVLNKPAGLAVHRGPKAAFGKDEALEPHFDKLKFGLPRAPALAHRLDRDTSGCLVLGRHRKALEDLFNLFRTGAIHKTYWAVVEGAPDTKEGLIDLPLKKRDAQRGWWMKVDAEGQPSQTRFRCLGTQNGLSLMALEPLTGRTHQLRVHMAAMGWPILGDPVYGSAPRQGGPALHLHAAAITIPLYKNKSPIAVKAPLPSPMTQTIAQMGLEDDIALKAYRLESSN